MGRMKENCRYNVVSLRVTDAEREALDALTSLTNMNLSTVMREAIRLLSHLPSVADAQERAGG